MTTAPAGPDSRFCVLEVAGLRFGLRLDSVAEIVPMAALSRPASMPSILEGMLNLRGTSVPVVRLASLLALPPDPLELHTPLVILRRETQPLAFLVRRAVGIAAVPAGGLLPIAGSDTFNACIAGRFTSEDGVVVHVLSLDRLILAKEEKTIAEYRTIETERLRQAEYRAS